MTYRLTILAAVLAGLAFGGCGSDSESPPAPTGSTERFLYAEQLPSDGGAAVTWHVRLTRGGTMTVTRDDAAGETGFGTFFLSDDETGHLWRMIDGAGIGGAVLRPVAGADRGEVRFTLDTGEGEKTVSLAAGALDANPALSELRSEIHHLVTQYARHTIGA